MRWTFQFQIEKRTNFDDENLNETMIHQFICWQVMTELKKGGKKFIDTPSLNGIFYVAAIIFWLIDF